MGVPRARIRAQASGHCTTEMTPGGSLFNELQLIEKGSRFSTELAMELWSILSRGYAQSAPSNTVGFAEATSPCSIFNTVEYPALTANSAVTSVITGGH